MEVTYIVDSISLRLGADQSSKYAFGKNAFVKTCSNLLYIVIDMTGAHQSSKKQKYFRARFGTCNEENAFFLKRAKMCSKAFLLFAWLMCASRIFNKRKHILAKALLPKAALPDWSAPSLRARGLLQETHYIDLWYNLMIRTAFTLILIIDCIVFPFLL